MLRFNTRKNLSLAYKTLPNVFPSISGSQAFRPFSSASVAINNSAEEHATSYTNFVRAAAIAAGTYAGYHMNSNAECPLSPEEFRTFSLEEVTQVSPDTYKISFTLPKDQSLELPITSCIVFKAPIGENGKDVIRPYTPTSANSETGHFDFVIKSYPNGLMSKYIGTLSAGDKVDIKGPWVKFDYKPNMKKEIGMLAGGSGITPMLQLLRETLPNADDKTKFTLIFGNQTEQDILLQSELDTLQQKYPNFRVYYIIDRATEGWTGHTGYVTKEMIEKYLPAPSDDTQILVCGPPGFMKAMSGGKTDKGEQGELTGHLKARGFTKDQVYKF